MSASAPHAAPPSKFTPATLIGVTEEDTFSVSLDESTRQVTSKFERLHAPSMAADKPALGYFCCNNPITARLQQGPTCGLVSLRMSAESIIERSFPVQQAKKDSSLLEVAKEKGYTGFGEMFSAYEMTSLAKSYFEDLLDAETWDSPWDLSLLQRLIQALISGGMALVPYDVDKNHEPCLAGGKKAHWAAIKGFIIPITTEAQVQSLQSLAGTESSVRQLKLDIGLPLFWLEPSHSNVAIDALALATSLSECLTSSQVRLITQQSKSKHQAIWTFESLQNSNHNLSRFDEDRVTSPEFKVPEILDTLRGKMVFLRPIPQESSK